MRKFTLLLFVSLAFAGFSNAQVIENFENIGLNPMLGGAEDLSAFSVVANPDPTGINESGRVAKFLRDKDGVPWGGFWSALTMPVDITDNKYVHVKVWKPRISPIKFKLEGGAAGTLELASMNAQTVTGAWEEIVFDFSEKTGTYPTVVFMPDFEDPLTLTEDIEIYFDDIFINNDPTPGSAAVYVIENFEHIPLNAMLGGAEDQSSMTLVPNPDQSGINTSYTVVEFRRDKDGVPWGGFWSNLPVPADVTDNKYVHVKVWKPRISPVKFKLEGGAAGTLEQASMYAQTLTGYWEDMVFDFTSKTGTYPIIAFMPDFEDPMTLTEDIVIYFDDFIINNDPNPITPTSQVLNVDMKGSGLTAGQKVYVAGSFGGAYGNWAEPGSNAACEMTDPDGDSTYTISLDVAAGTYQFKFFKGAGWNGGEWAGDPNRTITITNFLPLTFKWGVLSSSVDNIKLNDQVSIFPVPFDQTLVIHSTVNLERVVINSLTGQEMLRMEQLHPGQTSVDVSDLGSGLYFVTLYHKNGERITKKVVKN